MPHTLESVGVKVASEHTQYGPHEAIWQAAGRLMMVEVNIIIIKIITTWQAVGRPHDGGGKSCWHQAVLALRSVGTQQWQHS